MRRGLLTCLLALVFPAAAAATPGDLDPTYSRDGYVGIALGEAARATAIALDPQGRAVVAGPVSETEGEPAGAIGVARLTADGKLDPSFSGDGKALYEAGAAVRVGDVAVDDLGRIVVGASAAGDLLALRLTDDGSPDPAFSGDGIARADAGGDEGGGDMVLGPSSTATLGGSSCAAGKCRFVLARFDAAGAPDPGFGTGGIVLTSFPGDWAVINDLAATAGGGVRAAGDTRTQYHELAIAQYTASGTLDPSFNGGGLAVISENTQGALSIVVDSAGRMLGLGGFGLLYRVTAQAAIDPSFSRSYMPRGAFTIDSRDRVVAAGAAGGCSRGCVPLDTVVGRADAGTGAVDKGFGGSSFGDRALADLGAGPDGAYAVATDESDRPLTAGYADDKIAVARFEAAAGPPDQDADRVRDPRDACPLRFSHRANGCPLIKRRLTLQGPKRADLWLGRIRSSQDRCLQDQTVRVFKLRAGRDEPTTQATTDDDGHWSADANPRPGTYYARVERNFRERLGACARARSHAVTIRG